MIIQNKIHLRVIQKTGNLMFSFLIQHITRKKERNISTTEWRMQQNAKRLVRYDIHWSLSLPLFLYITKFVGPFPYRIMLSTLNYMKLDVEDRGYCSWGHCDRHVMKLFLNVIRGARSLVRPFQFVLQITLAGINQNIMIL